MRGVGYTLINFINNIPSELRKKHNFVFFYYQDEEYDDPRKLLELQNLSFEARPLHQVKPSLTLKLPGKLNVLVRLANKLLASLKQNGGDPRITNTKGIDVFLQTEQMTALPRGKFKKAFIAYDLIPYVLESDYLWNYKTARFHGLPRQAAIRCTARRRLYLSRLRTNVSQADKVLAISDVTKQDFIKYIPSSKRKIITTPLGVNLPKASGENNPAMSHYVASSWGYLKRPYVFDSSTPFLLFVGGADKRRRLDELVTAFNHLRAQGHDLKLVLVGDSMQGPNNIATETIQKALLDSSYLDDIVFMGFVSDEQRDWLYKKALAFVFPSKYEGFGLPVLEAMIHKCPVISYKNRATLEVAGDAAIYAESMEDLRSSVLKLLGSSKDELASLGQISFQQAQRYTWVKTSQNLLREIERLA